jgi:hypothetical protein
MNLMHEVPLFFFKESQPFQMLLNLYARQKLVLGGIQIIRYLNK